MHLAIQGEIGENIPEGVEEPLKTCFFLIQGPICRLGCRVFADVVHL
jgi:hypothetical protein